MRVKLLNLILHAGERKRHVLHFYAEKLFAASLFAQRIDGLARRERQLKELPGTVDKLTCRNVRRTADFLRMDTHALRRDV